MDSAVQVSPDSAGAGTPRGSRLTRSSPHWRDVWSHRKGDLTHMGVIVALSLRELPMGSLGLQLRWRSRRGLRPLRLGGAARQGAHHGPQPVFHRRTPDAVFAVLSDPDSANGGSGRKRCATDAIGCRWERLHHTVGAGGGPAARRALSPAMATPPAAVARGPPGVAHVDFKLAAERAALECCANGSPSLVRRRLNRP